MELVGHVKISVMIDENTDKEQMFLPIINHQLISNKLERA